MESDTSTVVEDYLREQAARPLGDVQLVSDRAAQRLSQPLHAGADNLLNKALRALDQGDRERAQGFVARAARLPFDEHEEQQPGLWSAHMTLFGDVTDALEDSDPGDAGWLDAALAVLETCGAKARLSLLGVLDVAQRDWKLEGRENKRIRRVLAGVDAEAELHAWLDSYHGDPESQGDLEQVILEILEAVLAYEEALAGL